MGLIILLIVLTSIAFSLTMFGIKLHRILFFILMTWIIVALFIVPAVVDPPLQIESSDVTYYEGKYLGVFVSGGKIIEADGDLYVRKDCALKFSEEYTILNGMRLFEFQIYINDDAEFIELSNFTKGRKVLFYGPFWVLLGIIIMFGLIWVFMPLGSGPSWLLG